MLNSLSHSGLILLALTWIGCASTQHHTPAGDAVVAKHTVTPFLMFQDGRAEEAMEFYAGLFDDGQVLSAERYGAEGPGPEGSLFLGSFTVGVQTVRATDSFIQHGFEFTPSWSLFVDCTTKHEVDRLAQALATEGQFMMPPGDYGFSQHFAWVQDRYGISWQLNLPFAPE